MSSVRAIVFLASLVASVAYAGEVPPEKLATILTRTLSYDDHLTGRAHGAVVIAVLWKSDDPRSKASADVMVPAFKRLEHVHVQGMPLGIVQLAWESPARLKAQLAEQGIDMLFVCPGLSSVVSQITTATRAAQVVTAAALPDDVRDGLSVGVSMEDSQSTISVNLAASRAEGAAFSSELLRLARIVR
jgi:hypothetical protein